MKTLEKRLIRPPPKSPVPHERAESSPKTEPPRFSAPPARAGRQAPTLGWQQVGRCRFAACRGRPWPLPVPCRAAMPAGSTCGHIEIASPVGWRVNCGSGSSRSVGAGRTTTLSATASYRSERGHEDDLELARQLLEHLQRALGALGVEGHERIVEEQRRRARLGHLAHDAQACAQVQLVERALRQAATSIQSSSSGEKTLKVSVCSSTAAADSGRR